MISFHSYFSFSHLHSELLLRCDLVDVVDDHSEAVRAPRYGAAHGVVGDLRLASAEEVDVVFGRDVDDRSDVAAHVRARLERVHVRPSGSERVVHWRKMWKCRKKYECK